MKPLGTNNAAENGLTTQKNALGKPISQGGLSTKPLKPRGTYHTRENALSASKYAFKPTNSPSRFATKNRFSIAPCYHQQRTKQPRGK
ncbi:hypothetical protein [Vibrio parahaemolyticus]|uniref:hypothetical protein n=1 Tax=Vibrio parahaemolyticus TaxID=670 RepID=UPI0011210FB9|nr:hypothetical protein [Vibrio parahaemolyticus]EGR2045971.1 hypothetical protein [Vibrio parahaemolyticus]TOC10429.1 hypothetical protein CGJ91_23845 [Vibrio parahaemolyticus]